MEAIREEGSAEGLAGFEAGAAPDVSSEVELVERAKTDPDAFGQLYEAHYGKIVRYIYRCTHDVAVAEDLTSNTFFKMLRALPKYRSRAPFSAWLWRIATNEIQTH